MISQDFKENETNKESPDKERRAPTDGKEKVLTEDEINRRFKVGKYCYCKRFFAKDLGMNTDILKLPQQLKSMRSVVATFAKVIVQLNIRL